ncbi:MAG: hypothetical protein RMI90_13010, partial [Thermoguttaceae bacterium]|nr:hypothetical protein [Thermoguttaceae bacterium]
MPEPLANPSVGNGSESLVCFNSRYIEVPPTEVWKILGRLGPGLIIAGAIVGSGELILTPKTGAQAGFSLLWLIILGCVIKV